MAQKTFSGPEILPVHSTPCATSTRHSIRVEMTGLPDEVPTLRLFVGGYPPEAVAQDLVDAARRLRLDGLRIVPAADLHVTMAFLGVRPTAELTGVVVKLRGACEGFAPLQVETSRMTLSPGRGRPRLLAIELEPSDALARLTASIERALQPAKEQSGREFWAHMTIGRFQRNRGRQVQLPAVPKRAFLLDRVRLMRSELTAGGARHSEIVRVQLESSREDQ